MDFKNRLSPGSEPNYKAYCSDVCPWFNPCLVGLWESICI